MKGEKIVPAGNRKRKNLEGNNETKKVSSEKMTIKEIEEELGFDKAKPIEMSPSEEVDFVKKGDYFNSWYEEELRAYYEKLKEKRNN